MLRVRGGGRDFSALFLALSLHLCDTYNKMYRYENIYRKGLYLPTCTIGYMVSVCCYIVAGIGCIAYFGGFEPYIPDGLGT